MRLIYTELLSGLSEGKQEDPHNKDLEICFKCVAPIKPQALTNSQNKKIISFYRSYISWRAFWLTAGMCILYKSGDKSFLRRRRWAGCPSEILFQKLGGGLPLASLAGWRENPTIKECCWTCQSIKHSGEELSVIYKNVEKKGNQECS